MADVVPTTFKQRLQMAGAMTGAVFAFNSMFWFASSWYASGKPDELVALGSVRIAFATLSLIVAAMAFLAATAPRLIGHALAAAMGIAALIGGFAALSKGMPPVMGTTMLIIGVLMPALTWKSLQYSRTAWSFLIAIVAVFGAVTFFGAPKVRGLLGIGLWYAMIIPGLQIVCVMALSMLRGEYRD
jgi:hypothetical protein